MSEAVEHAPECGWDIHEGSELLACDCSTTCHCGREVKYGFDGDPAHHRGMCADCDAVRCDAYPMECPHRERARR